MAAKDVSKFMDLNIDGTSINTLNAELEKQASSFVYVAQVYAEADAEYENYKLRVTQLRAALDERIRLDAAKNGTKTTETGIAKEIERHPDYVRAKEHEINLNRKKEELKNLMYGWRDRKDTLIQRCINERSSLEQMAHNTVRQ